MWSVVANRSTSSKAVRVCVGGGGGAKGFLVCGEGYMKLDEE